MPPWVASVPRSILLRNGRAIERLPPALRCRHHVARSNFNNLRPRSASTHVSPTTINLNPEIPIKNKELHSALAELEEAAGSFVNISRLQLALRGLLAQDGVTRIAILGLNSQVSAQRLARLLLADPLGAKGTWEKELESPGDGTQRAVLLKYGGDSDAQTPNPLYKVLSVPSRILRSHNLEILVSTLNVNAANNLTLASIESSSESILVPKLQAASASTLPTPFPVHKTLIYGEGLDSALAFGRFSADYADGLGDTVKLAVDLPATQEEVPAEVQQGSAEVNIKVGTEALASFRESIQNSIIYERGWFKSGLPILSRWLIHDLEPSQPLKPVMKSLITSIADDVEVRITKADVARLQELASTPTERDTSAAITSHLESWAENSHAELRDELDDAFTSKSWHRLSWWKLFWRVDDVTMISSEILERKWLTSAEKSSIYLAGRMSQAGFPSGLEKLAAPQIPEITTEETAPTADNPRTDLTTELRTPKAWFEHIPTARAELIADAVPPLQALAQRLILQTFSTTSLSSALSALLYVSVSSFSVFEASAVAALGLTFSLRRMQKLWEGARESWEGTAREEGRRTLKATEEVARLIVKSKGVGAGVKEDEGSVERRRAREAVRRVREVLGRVDG